MDLTSETISMVLDISNPITYTVKDVHGIETVHSSKPLHQVKAAAPEAAPIVKVVTLAGFADLVRGKLEDKDFPNDFLIHVEDEGTVVLKSRVSDEFGRRLALVAAKPVSFDRFNFGQWHDQESFAIALASRFAESEDKDYVLRMAGVITNAASTTSEDDGITQQVTIKGGVQLKKQDTLKPRVILAPYRTFPKVEQPASEFVFRARCKADEVPSLMLIEADGGAWKVKAIATIAKALAVFELNIPIIA